MGQEEEIFLYSFRWQMDYPEGRSVPVRVSVNVCMGMKLTEHLQAEFLGFAANYDIHGGVRYVTASFQEHEGYAPAISSVNDSNMAILSETQWEMDGMFDPFPWVEEFFNALVE